MEMECIGKAVQVGLNVVHCESALLICFSSGTTRTRLQLMALLVVMAQSNNIMLIL